MGSKTTDIQKVYEFNVDLVKNTWLADLGTAMGGFQTTVVIHLFIHYVIW